MSPSPTKPCHLCNPFSRALAALIEPFYAGAVRFRNAAYDHGWKRIHHAHVPVVSIGNLTTGGTGKTPMVACIARRLRSFGLEPAVLMRGYRADRSGFSDERALLQSLLGPVPVVAEPDRVAGAGRIARDYPQVNVILLDDGFQHRRLHRDLDLVLMDATSPWGFDHLLPRGLLREPPSSLRRADAVILTRCDLVTAQGLEAVKRQIIQTAGRPPLACCVHRWTQIVDEKDRPVTERNVPVHVVVGIGNPQAFVEQARQHFTLAFETLLPDHAEYPPDTPRVLGDALIRNKARALLTSEKDWVKLRRLVESHPLPVPVWRPKLALEFTEGEQALERLLNQAVSSPKSQVQ